MDMARAAKELFETNLKYSNGEPVKVVIADTTIGRVAEAAACEEKFRRENVAIDLEMLNAVCEIVSVPVIASGGAGKAQDFVELFKKLPKVDAGLAASIFHFGEVKINELKKVLKDNGILVRL